MMTKNPSAASLDPLLVFEFKAYEESSGTSALDSQLSQDNSSTLTSIADAVAKQGGSAAHSRSRSANRSSLRIAISLVDAQSRHRAHSESRSTTSALHTLQASFASAADATAFLRAAHDTILRWLQMRPERSLVFRHNTHTVVLKGRADIENLIAHLQRI